MPLTVTGPHTYTYTDPQTWDFPGSDWENPDPQKTDYWRALALAIMERQEAAGILKRSAAELFAANPFFPLVSPVRKIRDAVYTLAPHFLDWQAVESTVSTLPLSAEPADVEWEISYVVRTLYNDFPAFASCPPEGATATQLSAFIREARAILEMFRVTPWRWGLHHGFDRWGMGDFGGYEETAGGVYSSAVAEADRDYDAFDGEYYTDTSPGGVQVWGYTCGYVEFDDSYGSTSYAESAMSKDGRSAELAADNAPNETVLGRPWNPSTLTVYYSRKHQGTINGVPIAPALNVYASDNFEEGWNTGKASHNWRFVENPAWAEPPTFAPSALSAAALGSVTNVYLYADWQPCYVFPCSGADGAE